MVKGLKSLERKLTRKIPKAINKHLRVALAVFADKIVATAEGFVQERTGRLKNSIGWVWGDKIPDGAISLGTVSKSKGSDLFITVFVGDKDAFYVFFLEFGTSKSPAFPFFFPAYRLQKRAGKSGITRALKRGLREGSR